MCLTLLVENPWFQSIDKPFHLDTDLTEEIELLVETRWQGQDLKASFAIPPALGRLNGLASES